MVFALGQVVERSGNRDILAVCVACTGEACILIGPGTRRSKIVVSAEVLKVRLQVLVPTSVLTMDPLLLRVKRIVALTTGIEREAGGEARGGIVRTVIVAVVIVAVARTQKEMAAKNGWADRHCRRIGEAGLRVDARIEIHRCEQHTT